MFIFSRRKRTASLTIEDNAIRYVGLKSIDPLIVDIAEEIPIPANVVVEGKIVDPETLADILNGAIDQWKIAKRTVQFLAPDSYVIVRKVAYPDDILDDELKGYFFIEIGSTLYLPFTDPVFDVVPYKPNTDTNEAIIIASQENVLNAYEQLFENVKLDPVAADIVPLALYRLAYKQHQFTGDEHVMIADLNGEKLTVSIFHEHYPLFMRPVDLGNTADLAVITSGQVNDSAVSPPIIVTELEKLINFYRYNMCNGEETITHLLVNGEYEFLDSLLQRINENIDVTVHKLLKKPIQLVSGQELPDRFNRTIGLALKEV